MAESDLSLQRLSRRVDSVEVAIADQMRGVERSFVRPDELEQVRVEIFNEIERIKLEDLQVRQNQYKSQKIFVYSCFPSPVSPNFCLILRLPPPITTTASLSFVSRVLPTLLLIRRIMVT